MIVAIGYVCMRRRRAKAENVAHALAVASTTPTPTPTTTPRSASSSHHDKKAKKKVQAERKRREKQKKRRAKTPMDDRIFPGLTQKYGHLTDAEKEAYILNRKFERIKSATIVGNANLQSYSSIAKSPIQTITPLATSELPNSKRKSQKTERRRRLTIQRRIASQSG